MKRAALFTLLSATTFAALADNATFVDRARVQDVQPQYETVQVPRNECRTEWVTENQPVNGSGGSGYGGAVVGGATGALIGAQVGKGHGKEAAIAAGAVIGAITGDRIANNNTVRAPAYEPVQREVRTCRTVNDTQTRLVGYRVTYDYRGHQYTTLTREQPGNSVPVRVSVTPLDEREYDRR